MGYTNSRATMKWWDPHTKKLKYCSYTKFDEHNNKCGKGCSPGYELMLVTNTYTRGYIPKVFAFKNPYPLNPKKSDLFYFLLIRTKWPKSPKLQRAVSSSSTLHTIKRIPRDTTTLALLWILLQNVDSRGMSKSLLKVPTVVDFALTV